MSGCGTGQGRLVRECNRAIIGQARHHVYCVDASNPAEVRRQMSKDEFSSSSSQRHNRKFREWTTVMTPHRPLVTDTVDNSRKFTIA